MVPPSEDSEPELPHRSEPCRFGPSTSLEALVASVGDLRAAELINGGVPELLVRGELEYLRRELCTPTAERLAQLRDGGIAPALLRTSAVLAYSEPDAAGALLDLLPWGYEAPAWLDERAAVAPHLASQLQGDLPEPLGCCPAGAQGWFGLAGARCMMHAVNAGCQAEEGTS